ncbi:hypothetical protein GCM10010399_66070 [Dactylosporangium fulvum]
MKRWRQNDYVLSRRHIAICRKTKDATFQSEFDPHGDEICAANPSIWVHSPLEPTNRHHRPDLRSEPSKDRRFNPFDLPR